MKDPILQSKPEEVETHSGVAREDRRDLAGYLSEALADTYLLYVKTQGFHWNVVGPLFYSLHKLTEEQYEDMAEAIDTLAERIRAIGFPAPSSFHQFKLVASVEEETGMPTAEQMIQQLVDGNEICSRKLRKAVSEADRVGDVKTADLLTERIGQHEENAWMLRALLA
ncbi:DNA starvation/stationary phase protection protein [Exilibacterium tricleocarpae]|uniref:DNA starvation/stationary phase protection protein n=1 Tax=Exilibacterium tricleocarpae TaxID=2591008 RepID=A0A545TNK1_9GAMM|nr:DNA starvation/stationary phase protection protein [Exilibacterium tricleocarpae]TQV78799.1 DNA starvation/stationary phase protection protein [Exilibacterium tricleocarpae]